MALRLPRIEDISMERTMPDLKVGLAKHQRGNLAGAERVYRSILAVEPDHAGAWHLLGLTSFAKEQYEQAKTEIERALALCDTKAVYWSNYGAVLRELGLTAEAKEACERALVIAPRFPDALSNLALCLRDLGEKDRAYHVFHEALTVAPGHRDALRHLAELCRKSDRVDEAVRCCQNLVKRYPNDPASWRGLAESHASAKRPTEAVEAFRKAAALDPDNATVQVSLGHALAAQGKHTEAKAAFGQGARLQPDRPSWRFRHLGNMPQVFPDAEAIDDYFEDLEEQLDGARFDFDWRRCLEDGFAPPFGITHQGRCCRAIKEKFAALFARHFPHQRPSPRETSRLRIGFLVARGLERGFLRNMEHIVAKIDPERFEAVVLCEENGQEVCRKRIPAEHVRWVSFPADFEAAVKTITESACDILYHRQIGTSAWNYFLPFARCAPVQCTGWGSHGTTGLEAIDYYLSSDLIEIEGARSHYTERLFQFHGTLPTCQSRVKRRQPASRGDFGLPEQGALYFCPQRIEKIHPDFDALVRGVLDSDPSGTVLMLQGRHPAALDELRARFRRTLGPSLAPRVTFVGPTLPAEVYYRLLSLADVVLDTPNYSTSLTGFDACSYGIPIVTLPGARNVERYALALYRKLGIEDLIAVSAEDYVAKAVRTARDPDYRKDLHERILTRSEALFEDMASVKEHERFFEYAWQRREQSKTG